MEPCTFCKILYKIDIDRKKIRNFCFHCFVEILRKLGSEAAAYDAEIRIANTPNDGEKSLCHRCEGYELCVRRVPFCNHCENSYL